MATTLHDMARAYFRQQAEMGMPDITVAGPQPVGDSREEKRRALVELYRATENCRKCAPGKLRNKFVFGSGNAAAPVVVIGEAPGEEEDRQGKPFVGAAGQLLTKMLAAINLDRNDDVFITNILKCRPPANRNPDDSEAQTCSPILARQIEIIRPKIILLLGRIAARGLLGRAESIAKLRAEKLDYKGTPVVVTYHPAALLRNASYKSPAWEDLKKLQKMLKEV